MPSRKRGVAAFLAISFTGTWLWLFTGHLALGLPATHLLLQLPSFCMPGVAALIVRRWITKEGFADAGMRLRLREAWPYYLAAWLGPLAIAATAIGLAALFGLWHPAPSALDDLMPGLPGGVALLVLMVAAPLLTPVYWGEEFGWTSYLRPRLYGGRPLPSVLLTGLIWASWHFPLAFLGYIHFSSAALGLAVWTLSFLCQETILAWLFVRSGSVWTASLAHCGNNLVLSLLIELVLDDQAGLGAISTTLLVIVPMAAVCLWIVLGGKLAYAPGGHRARDLPREPYPAEEPVPVRSS